LFGVSSICTHAGCEVSWRSTSMEFHCPCHSANFALTGDVISGPTGTPLDHYPLCLTSHGTVGMDTNQTDSPSNRYNF
jgi:Rieske Fe-S protein